MCIRDRSVTIKRLRDKLGAQKYIKTVYGIGYISLGSLDDTVKAVKIDGVEATVDNVSNDSYKDVYKRQLQEIRYVWQIQAL